MTEPTTTLASLAAQDPLAALDRLAADLAAAPPETGACPSIWPLLAVPGDGLTGRDRDARDHHLATCARCRIIAVETWLDQGEVPALAALPVATVLPALPRPRRSRRSVYAALGVAAAAILAVGSAVVAPMLAGAPGTQLSALLSIPRAPLDLLILVDGQATFLGHGHLPAGSTPAWLGDKTFRAVQEVLAKLKQTVPPDTRVTLATATGDTFDVRLRDAPVATLSAAALGTAADYQDNAASPDYPHVLDRAAALLPANGHRRALLVLGTGCDAWSGTPAAAATARSAALERLDAAGIAVLSVTYWNEEAHACAEPSILRMGTARSVRVAQPDLLADDVTLMLARLRLDPGARR